MSHTTEPLVAFKVPSIERRVSGVQFSLVPRPTFPHTFRTDRSRDRSAESTEVADNMHRFSFKPPSASTAMARVSRGFTLIEVMIVVAIIGILAAIALPAYRDYVLRGQLVDATNLLSAAQTNMERYFQDNRQYSAASGTIVPPCADSVPVAQRTQGSFVLTCNSPAPSQVSYALTAQGSGPTAAFTYTVAVDGSKTTTVGAGAPAGWATPSPNTCWMVKKGQPC